MYIFIDEAGSFVHKGAAPGSCCVVAAYLVAEPDRPKCEELLRQLKLRTHRKAHDEVKLKDISEDNYLWFLGKLSKLNASLLCIATDSYLNSTKHVESHQNKQVSNLLSNVDQMRYDRGKQTIELLASQLARLPHQLYVQLFMQIQLMHSVTDRGISYFVQRQPAFLRSFRWRIDQKEPATKTDFEHAFEKYSPMILQMRSIENPGSFLDWCDYGAMRHFLIEKGEFPEYLTTAFPHLASAEGVNIQKIIRDDIQFVDSKSLPGVQIADLLASGVRKLLRQEFKDPQLFAKMLGGVMIQNSEKKPPIEFFTLGQGASTRSGIASIATELTSSARPMLINKASKHKK